MKSERKCIYDSNMLTELVNKKYTCLCLVNSDKKVNLSAKYLNDIQSGVKKTLNGYLNKFDYGLNGFLLDYQNVKIKTDSDTGRIAGRFGEYLVTINADFYVFQPQIGSLLEGEVHAKAETHIVCLVHKYFKAMIPKPENIEFDEWDCRHLDIEDKVIFEIVDYVFSDNVTQLEGKISHEKISTPNKSLSKKSKNAQMNLSQNGVLSTKSPSSKSSILIVKSDDDSSEFISPVQKSKSENKNSEHKRSKEKSSKKVKNDLDSPDKKIGSSPKAKKKKTDVESIGKMDYDTLIESSRLIDEAVAKLEGKQYSDELIMPVKEKKKKAEKEKANEIAEPFEAQSMNELTSSTKKQKKKKKDKDKKDSTLKNENVPCPETVPAVDTTVEEPKKPKKKKKSKEPEKNPELGLATPVAQSPSKEKLYGTPKKEAWTKQYDQEPIVSDELIKSLIQDVSPNMRFETPRKPASQQSDCEKRSPVKNKAKRNLDADTFNTPNKKRKLNESLFSDEETCQSPLKVDNINVSAYGGFDEGNRTRISDVPVPVMHSTMVDQKKVKKSKKAEKEVGKSSVGADDKSVDSKPKAEKKSKDNKKQVDGSKKKSRSKKKEGGDEAERMTMINDLLSRVKEYLGVESPNKNKT